MAIVNDSMIYALLKDTYLRGVANSKNQASPIISRIKKENWNGGKTIKYAAQYGNGGNFGSNYAVVSNNPTSGVMNLEWAMDPKYSFGLFQIDMPELLSTADEKGAYMQALENKMSACFDGIGKTMAMHLYGGTAGVIDKLTLVSAYTVLASGNVFSLSSAGALKLDVGSRFVIATSPDSGVTPATPYDDLLGGNTTPVVFTVTAIDDTSITASASVAGGTIYSGDYIELYTARTGNDYYGIEGLFDILPSFDDRNSTGYNNYMSSLFRGVRRDVAESRLAGQYATTTGKISTTPITDTLVELLMKTKRAGGINDMIIINDETFNKASQELGLQRNLWQATNGDTANKQTATAGLNRLGVAFEDAFVSKTIVDPYCMNDNAYMVDIDNDLKLYDMGNVSKALDPVGNGSLGKYDVEAVGSAGIPKEPVVGINFDKLFTVAEGQKGITGKSLEITANVYANFALRKTASSGVAYLG